MKRDSEAFLSLKCQSHISYIIYIYIYHKYKYKLYKYKYICYICFFVYMFEGSLEVKLPTIWTDEKQSREEAERRERSEGKKMEMREKVGKSRNTVFFQ